MMNKEQMIDLLHAVSEKPWDEAFDKQCCKKCETIDSRIDQYTVRSELYCAVMGHCRFLPRTKSWLDERNIIEWWLQQPATDETRKMWLSLLEGGDPANV